MRQTDQSKLNPCRCKGAENRHRNSDENGRANPDPKTAIIRVVNGSMRSVEVNHREMLFVSRFLSRSYVRGTGPPSYDSGTGARKTETSRRDIAHFIGGKAFGVEPVKQLGDTISSLHKTSNSTFLHLPIPGFSRMFTRVASDKSGVTRLTCDE
jgi:hypothetical protein